MPPTPADFAGALVLTGPTGSGKSAAALELAERFGGEILALDSMTLYRGMDVGTAKPTAADRARVPHHLLDLLDPWESANVAWWLGRAAEAVQVVLARGRRPIFVGGTPFYLKALLNGLFEAPPINPEIRTKWEAEAALAGQLELHARLAAVDPPTAARLHPNDVRRVVRALEVFEATGRPISAFQQTWDTPPADIPAVVVERPTDELNRRIDARVNAMIAAGWLAEVAALDALPRPLSKEAAQALGYPELRGHLRGKTSLADAINLIRQRTKQFAKRQRTWFRSMPFLRRVNGDGPDVAGRIAAAWGL